jgi:hypothetical protein
MNFLPRFRFGPKTTNVVATAAAVVFVSAAGYQAYKRYKSHKKWLLQQETQKRLKEEQESAFENKFFNEYDQLKDDPDAPVPSATSHVRETTPQGDVIMTYDDSRKTFCYYSDKRTIQFKYLEPVARKYVIEHRCKRLYIDFRKELMKAKTALPTSASASATASATTSATATASTKSSPVFAQLKKYSSIANKQPNNSTMPTINELVSSKVAAPSNNAPTVLKEQVTKYLHCGRLDEFNANEHQAHETHDFSIIKPIDYASYKKMNDT